MRTIEVIYEDKDILLCRKPAGVATQTKSLGQQDMESMLKNYRAKKGEPPYIGVVHRLDQPVEGIMVFAKNQKAAAALSKQIQGKTVGKHYYAVSDCEPAVQAGELENYLLTDKKTNYTEVVDVDELPDGTAMSTIKLPEGAKKAKLEYHVLKTIGGRTLFDIKLHTGRQHQIRVQMAHMGCPLVGDNKYGRECGPSQAVTLNRVPLALCSYRLEFSHPITGKMVDYSIIPQGKAFEGFDMG